MLSSEWKASLRAWSEGVKYCWRLEDWAEDDPAVPPDQSISRREAGAWACTGPQLADLSWPRRCEDWGWGWGDSDRHWPVRATAGHNKGAAQQLCLSVRDLRWGEQESRDTSVPSQARAQGHESESCQEQILLQCWHMREECGESPNLVGRESLIASDKVMKQLSPETAFVIVK